MMLTNWGDVIVHNSA